jgi:phosphoserine phosphatase
MAKKILVVTPGCDAQGHLLPITEAQKAQLEDETMLAASGVSYGPGLRNTGAPAHTHALEGVGGEPVGYAALTFEALSPCCTGPVVQAMPALAEALRLDWAFINEGQKLSDFKVLAMDMDSTVINIECIDEIADFCGKKAEVAAITEAAMRGEIADYGESLRRRVALLKGLPESVLQKVIDERLQINPGARELVAAAKAAGLHTLLVSGGFTQFTRHVAQALGFDQVKCNELEIRDGVLTGGLVGELVDGAVKKSTFEAACGTRGAAPTQGIAIGDGANDLPMMSVAGISVAYRAKPAVAEKASRQIRFGRLDSVLVGMG